jgi:hypothetical protein
MSYNEAGASLRALLAAVVSGKPMLRGVRELGTRYLPNRAGARRSIKSPAGRGGWRGKAGGTRPEAGQKILRFASTARRYFHTFYFISP